jgi:hypothetical protein
LLCQVPCGKEDLICFHGADDSLSCFEDARSGFLNIGVLLLEIKQFFQLFSM